jgi:hypothetical protein
VLAFLELPVTHTIDGAILRCRHEPGARVIRHTGLRPLFERNYESIMGQLFGYADIAHDARQPRNQAR